MGKDIATATPNQKKMVRSRHKVATKKVSSLKAKLRKAQSDQTKSKMEKDHVLSKPLKPKGSKTKKKEKKNSKTGAKRIKKDGGKLDEFGNGGKSPAKAAKKKRAKLTPK